MVRTPCCKAELGLKKGAWTPEEDQKLLSYVNRHGEGGWRTLPEKAGLKRCGKSCRLRWANYLRPDIKRGEFTEHEEHSIISLHSIHGNRWSAIARGLPGRTDNEIKNYWNTHIKKRLIKSGVDPVTHKNINSESSQEKKQNVIVDDENDKFKKKQSSAKFLNRVANRFGKRFNQSVLTEIISSGGGPQRSVSVDSESEKSTNYSSVKTTPSSSTFSDSSSVDGGLNIDDVAFSRFMSDEDFRMLEESCYDENNVFMNELTRFLQGEVENDVVQVMKTPPHLYYDQDVFEEIDNYFG